jgi:hypothetical protein
LLSSFRRLLNARVSDVDFYFHEVYHRDPEHTPEADLDLDVALWRRYSAFTRVPLADVTPGALTDVRTLYNFWKTITDGARLPLPDAALRQSVRGWLRGVNREALVSSSLSGLFA